MTTIKSYHVPAGKTLEKHSAEGTRVLLLPVTPEEKKTQKTHNPKIVFTTVRNMHSFQTTCSGLVFASLLDISLCISLPNPSPPQLDDWLGHHGLLHSLLERLSGHQQPYHFFVPFCQSLPSLVMGHHCHIPAIHLRRRHKMRQVHGLTGVLSALCSRYAYATAQFVYKPHKLSWEAPRRQYFPQQKLLCSVHLVLHHYLSLILVFTCMILSPIWSPATSAGPPSVTLVT